MFDFVTYMGIFLISSFFTKIYSKYYAKEKFFVRKFIVGFLAVVPILFLSIYRYEVGNDYRNYIGYRRVGLFIESLFVTAK